jgi:hypothetical protein
VSDPYADFKEFPIALGLGCAVDCLYCPQAAYVPAYKALGGPRVMTPDLLAHYLRSVPRDSILVWSGFSEPLLNPHLPKMIRQYHEAGWKMRLDTTLAGCTREAAELVASIPWTMLKLHLPSMGDKMRLAVDDEYLANLRAVCQNPCFKCFVWFGIPYLTVKEIVDAAPGQRDNFTSLHSRAGNNGTGIVAPVAKIPRKTGRLRECLWLRRGHLLPNGKLCLCCEDWSLMHVFGDLNTQTYQEIFESEAFRELLAAHEDDSKPLLCRTCTSGHYPS